MSKSSRGEHQPRVTFPKVPKNREIPEIEYTPAERFEAGESHRRRVTEWLVSGFEPGAARCAIIGPGVGMHVELPRLREHFVQVDWLDTTDQAVSDCLELQGVERSGFRIDVIGDLVGMAEVSQRLADQAKEETPRFHDVQEAIETVQASTPWPLGGDYDIVLVAELLPWLASVCAAAIGRDHPSLPDWTHAIRTRVMQQVHALSLPTGYGVLIHQLVSSRTMPSLPTIPPKYLESVLTELIQLNRIPYGSDPRKLMALLEHDPEFKSLVAGAQLLRPWMFFGGDVHHAMCGVSWQWREPLEAGAEEVL